MKQIQVFQCEVCQETNPDRELMINHERDCLEKVEKQKEKDALQAEAQAYLNTFRLRSTSVEHLLKMIEDEMSDIVKAVKTLDFYDKDIEVARLYEFTFGRAGFASARDPHPMRMTHSAPIGKEQYSMLVRDGEKPLAFEVEIFYRTGKGICHNVLDRIAGLNTGSGGSASDNRMHYYTALWMDDFPLGFDK